ncbi:hypothetical protein CRM22_001810, partial [Opisthorchis felineus]
YVQWVLHKDMMWNTHNVLDDAYLIPECAERCAQTPHCIAFDWKDSSRLCGYVRWPATAEFRRSKGHTAYSIKCCCKRSQQQHILL